MVPDFFTGFIGRTRLVSLVATQNEWKRHATERELAAFRECISKRRIAPIFGLGAAGNVLMYLAGPHGQLVVGATADLLGTGGFGMVLLGAGMLIRQGRDIAKIKAQVETRRSRSLPMPSSR